MRVDFRLKRKSGRWEIIAEIEEAGAVQIWRSRNQPTTREFRLAVFSALAGMSAMADIAGLKMEFSHVEQLADLSAQ